MAQVVRVIRPVGLVGLVGLAPLMISSFFSASPLSWSNTSFLAAEHRNTQPSALAALAALATGKHEDR